MDAQTLLLESLDSRRDQYRGNLMACRRDLTESSVHDLRVATRRLLALVDLVRAVAPCPGARKIREALKAHLDRFDDLRDTQVMLEEITKNPEKQPDRTPFRQYLEKRERRLLRRAGKFIRAQKPGGLARRLKNVRGELEGQDADLYERSLQAVDKTFLSAIQRYRRIDPAHPATIHRVRIAFKHFRYTLEVIHPLLGNFPEANLARMQAYQTQMGDIQNAEVFQRALTRFEERRASIIPHPIHRHCQRRRARLIAAYLKNKGELFTFWRTQPDQPFPWEAPHEPVHRPARHR